MRILFFGDSITQGFHDEECGGWVSSLSALTNEKTVHSDYEYDVSIFNLGVSGDNTKDLLVRFENEATARLEDRKGSIIFSIGVNDSQYETVTLKNEVSEGYFEENLISLIIKSRKLSDNIIFLGLTPIDEQKLMPIPWKPTHSYDVVNVKKYDEIIKKVCEKEKITYVPMLGVFNNHDMESVIPDGVHPNAKGHRVIFERLKDFLESEQLI